MAASVLPIRKPASTVPVDRIYDHYRARIILLLAERKNGRACDRAAMTRAMAEISNVTRNMERLMEHWYPEQSESKRMGQVISFPRQS